MSISKPASLLEFIAQFEDSALYTNPNQDYGDGLR